MNKRCCYCLLYTSWMNEADVDLVITHPEGYELDPKFVRGAKVEYNQMKAFEGAEAMHADAAPKSRPPWDGLSSYTPRW